MQPMWHVIPPHPQYATDDWRQLIMAAATQATQQLAQAKGPVGGPRPCLGHLEGPSGVPKLFSSLDV